MSGKYVLYGGGVSRGAGPQLVLEEIGLDYDLVFVDLEKDEHRAPAYLALNPAGLVPALVTPAGDLLHEAAAIMLYLAEWHGREDLAPPADDPDRGRFLTQLFYQTNDIQPVVKRYFRPEQASTEPADAPRIQAAMHAAARDRWGVLDTYLAENGPWHLGDRFSLADMHMALWAAYGLAKPTDVIDAFASVRRVFEGVRARPSCGPILDALQTAMVEWTDKTGR